MIKKKISPHSRIIYKKVNRKKIKFWIMKMKMLITDKTNNWLIYVNQFKICHKISSIIQIKWLTNTLENSRSMIVRISLFKKLNSQKFIMEVQQKMILSTIKDMKITKMGVIIYFSTVIKSTKIIIKKILIHFGTFQVIYHRDDLHFN